VISESDIDRTLDWLVKNAGPAAAARAARLHIEEFRKTKKALLMAQSDAKTIADREAYAYSHPEYIELLEGYRAAVEADERFRWLQETAHIRIETWRTLCSNARVQAKIQ